ncbi:MAG: AAA family ATPase [Mailhella sp.]|nr:AAA family ATPase [Mailhella sp.]
MRILNIRFRNLNSLAGDWSIDLEAPEFESNGIFAITGPTGSGKSTILDAICLALYASTPRLSKVNSKEENDILTRHCGDCFAEVTFRTVHGKFRCCWSQHRARKKPSGPLQDPKHELFDEEGRSLASGIKEVGKKVEELTGMDFTRFTQSTLLAQGSFAAFLLSKGDERAVLLEKMTGTGIYSEISKYIFEQNKLERSRLNELDARLALCAVLSEEAETELRARSEAFSAEISAQNAQEQVLGQKLDTLRTLAALKQEHDSLLAEKADLSSRNEAFQPSRQ